jgi:hypothetical protein
MDETPPLSSITFLFGGSAAPTSVPDSGDGKGDTDLSPSRPPLTLRGVGTYDDTVGVPLAKAKQIPFSFNGMKVHLAKDGSGTFTEGNMKGTYRVKDGLRKIQLETVGPEGTTYTGMKDELVEDAYNKSTGRAGREIVTVFYRIPPSRVGEDTQVGLQWVSPYVPTETFATRSSFVPKRKDLVVPSAALNPDGSLDLQILKIAKPLTRFSSNHYLSARSATEHQAPDMVVTEGF